MTSYTEDDVQAWGSAPDQPRDAYEDKSAHRVPGEYNTFDSMPGLNGNDLTATKDILDAVQALSLALTDNRALIAALFTDNERLRAKAGEVAKLNKLVAMQRAAIDAQNEQDGYSLASITRQAENAISHCRRGNNTLAEYQLAKMLGDITGNYRGWEE